VARVEARGIPGELALPVFTVLPYLPTPIKTTRDVHLLLDTSAEIPGAPLPPPSTASASARPRNFLQEPQPSLWLERSRTWRVYSIAESWGAGAPDKAQCQPLKHGHFEILPDDEKNWDVMKRKREVGTESVHPPEWNGCRREARISLT
jgi:hypothetical protein